MESQIAENKRLTYVYLAVMLLLAMVLGYGISMTFGWGLTGTGAFLIGAGVIDLLAYFFSDKLVLMSVKAKKIDRETAPELYEMVERVAARANIPTPKVYLIAEEAMNALATGRNEKHAVIAVSKGLVEKLNHQELEGVIAHEMAHIKYGDMRLAAVVAVLVGIISILADIIWRSNVVSKAGERDNSGLYGIVTMALALGAPMAAMFVQLALSRKREFLADSGGALLVGNSQGLRQALIKISRDNIPLPAVGYATAHLYFNNPFEEGGWMDKIMATHPPIQERINKLNI